MLMRLILLFGSMCLATAVAAQPNNPFAPPLPTGPGPYQNAPPDPFRPQVPPQMHPEVPYFFCYSASGSTAMMLITYVFQSRKSSTRWENDLDNEPSLRPYQAHFTCVTYGYPEILQKRKELIINRTTSFREISVKSDY